MRRLSPIIILMWACQGEILSAASAATAGTEPSGGGADASVPLPGALVSPTRYLRQLSLDLRGRLPSPEEYAAARSGVTSTVIDNMLRSPEFGEQVKDWHAEVLWPNLDRYKVKVVPLFASPRGDPRTDPLAQDAGLGGLSNPLADPLLATNEAARQIYGVGYLSEYQTRAFRGGEHAWGINNCDLSDDAEYPAPTAVGTPANEYTVLSSKSGTGVAYKRKFYSEESDSYGMVLPLYTPAHCPNFCRKEEARCPLVTDATQLNGELTLGNNRFIDCYSPMDTPGDQPGGRHELDAPGMRCAPGSVREVNRCDFWKGSIALGNPYYDMPNGAKVRTVQRANHVFGNWVGTFNNQAEGWRWEKHYWSQGKAIKTCALEAQEREFGLYARDSKGAPVRCDEITSFTAFYYPDPSCGCGPKGAYCQPADLQYATTLETRNEKALRQSIEQEPLEIIKSVVENDEDYFTILNTKKGVANGPLAFSWRYQTPVLRGEGFRSVSGPGFTDPKILESIDFEDAKWHPYTRDARNSGILTTLGFLIRFPTDRARIAQYRRAFLCSTEFDYAPEPEPSDTNPDITTRKGCSGCHSVLDKEGLFFGRYPDRQAYWLDPASHPLSDKTWQTPFQFRTDEEKLRLDQGPSAMVERDLSKGVLASCAVRTTAKRLLQREPTDKEKAAFLEELSTSGHSYRALVKAIVSSPGYRSEEAP